MNARQRRDRLARGSREAGRVPVEPPGARPARFRLLRGILLFSAIAVLAPACRKVDYVEIAPAQVVMKRRGEGLLLRALPKNRNGFYFPRLPARWSIDDRKVAKIDDNGQLTAVGPGRTVVSAEVEGHTGSADVTVESVESIRITPNWAELKVDDPAFRPSITPLDWQGHELRGRSIEMKAADENVADVDGEQVWPVGPGHTIVTVRVDDRTAPIDVTVTGPAKPAGKRHRH